MNASIGDRATESSPKGFLEYLPGGGPKSTSPDNRIPSTTRRRPWPKVAVVQVVLPENDPLFLSSPCQPLSTLDRMYYFVETAAV